MPGFRERPRTPKTAAWAQMHRTTTIRLVACAQIPDRAIRYWRRTGRDDLLAYVDEMSHHMELFKRGTGDDQPYYDRSDGKRFGDFLLVVRKVGIGIWGPSDAVFPPSSPGHNLTSLNRLGASS